MSPEEGRTAAGAPTVPAYLYPGGRGARPGQGRAPRALARAADRATRRASPTPAPTRRPRSSPKRSRRGRDGSTPTPACACSTATGSRCRSRSTAADPEAAGEAATTLGGRVALKAHGPQILHKTELGAVRAGLAGAEEVARRPRRWTRRWRPPGSSARASWCSRWSRRRRAARRRRHRSRLRPGRRLRGRWHRRRAARRRLGPGLPAERGRRRGDGPLARDLPDADRLPGDGAGGPRRLVRARPSRRCPRRGPPRDRRARPQPGDRHRERGFRRRCPRQGRRPPPVRPWPGTWA